MPRYIIDIAPTIPGAVSIKAPAMRDAVLWKPKSGARSFGKFRVRRNRRKSEPRPDPRIRNQRVILLKEVPETWAGKRATAKTRWRAAATPCDRTARIHLCWRA